LTLGHGFEQGRLDFRWRAVNFVRQNQVVKERSCLKFEGALLRPKYLAAGNIRGQKVWGELHALKVTFNTLSQRFNGLSFGQSRSTFDQQVPVGQKGDNQSFDQMLLAHNLLVEPIFE
jgi:hypothetical protein